VLINTTPVGMYPNCGEAPVSLKDFPYLTGVLDVVYNPLRTALIMDAEQRGLPCACGLSMLVAQAKRAAELFTDTTIDDGLAGAVLAELTAQLENIVLVGMPGCGKSTVGQVLAQKLGKRFVDIDGEIAAEAMKTIPEIFREEGEDAFRRRESLVTCRVGRETGCVISTGGGVVTRGENYFPLRQNGVIIHLLRDLGKLPTDGRPLSQTNAPQELWRRRAPLYAAFADLEIDNNGAVEDTVNAIMKEMNAR